MKSWTALLQETLTESADKVPKGWQTTREVAVEMGKSTGRARDILTKLMDAKKVKMQTFKIMTARGIYPVPHYRKG